MSSPFQKMFTTKTPFHQGGYEGGGDIAGAQYVPTGQMYANMFAKIGQAIADIDANKKKKEKEKENNILKTFNIKPYCPPGQNC